MQFTMRPYYLDNGIGGYFSLEIPQANKTMHKDCLKVNTCRNALLLLAKTKKYIKIFLPYYSCTAISNVLTENGIAVGYYKIDKKLEIVDPPKKQKNEAILYINYFGIKDKYVKKISSKYKNLIIDNAQSFFSKPENNVDTIYCPRKFFGVPDGGLLYTRSTINFKKYPQDCSSDRCTHLLKRIEFPADNAYEDFVKNEKTLAGLPIKRMSALTQAILSQVSYETTRKRRKKNFLFIHDELGKSNSITINNKGQSCMAYPYLSPSGEKIKQNLIKNKIYIATYWPDVKKKAPADSFENYLAKHLVPIPIDQRYGEEELKSVLNLIKRHEK
jgi:hypothetical protein